MTPKFPIKASDGSLTADVSRLTVADGTIGANGDINLASNAVYDIRDFGAAVDGVTDDNAAILAAITEAKTNRGGIIYFPPGTTKIGAGGVTAVNFTPAQGSIIFQGSGSESKVLLVELGAAYAFAILSALNVTFRDFVIIGESVGSASSDNYESTYPWIYTGVTWNVVFERMQFLGLSTDSTDGGIHSATSNTVFRDCLFGGCCAPNGGVVQSNNNYSLGLDTCEFWDTITFDGVAYNKGSALGVGTKNWVRHINPAALVHGVSPASYLRNSKFDEGRSESNVYVLGTTKTSFDIDNCEFAGGAISLLLACIKVDTLHKLTVTNTWAGLNAGPWPSIIADDVANVIIDGLIHDDGATDIQLTGTTSRVWLRRCQDVTITNTAGAFIDADQAMPATASAAALAPLGKRTHVTGTDAITSITTTNLKAGDELTLIFDSTATLTDGNNIKAAGNLSATADDTWTGVYDGTNVYEVGRSVN